MVNSSRLALISLAIFSAASWAADEVEFDPSAPLGAQNVSVHVLQRGDGSRAHRFELVAYPLAVQIDNILTNQVGSLASVHWYLHENFSFHVTGGYNWINQASDLSLQLLNRARVEAPAASTLLSVWDLMGGVEVVPFYGKFALFDSMIGHFGVVLSGGLGAGGTRHQLKPEVKGDGRTPFSPATYGDTGLRLMGSLGAGIRVQLGQSLSLRIELRNVVFMARVDRINGCDVNDLQSLKRESDAAGDLMKAPVSSQCRAESFLGTREGSDQKRTLDIPLAIELARSPTSLVRNAGQVFIGLSLLL